ncbi:MAG: adenosine kinase [Spirochaetes bacterium]|nr:adenosine kinase [Spirochaetota bacterium]
MMEIKNRKGAYDVLGMGSALLDFTVPVEDADLEKLGLRKGGMQLIDEDRSREILAILEGKKMEVTPGGSAANTLAGISTIGGKGMFLGAVGNDPNGDRYVRDTELAGVKAQIGRHDGMTGHAITFITPDSERTFATHLGAALQLNRDDVREDQVRNARIIHIEGYLFEPTGLREACMRALEIARSGGVLVSIDLSDPSLVDRIRPVFELVAKEYADIIFANEEEARAFTGREREAALDLLSRYCGFAVVKLGSDGSLISTGGAMHRISVCKTSVINTNGAGDMYAAGVLYGIAHGLNPERAGAIGSYVSSKVVAQVGARFPGKISVDALS